MVDKKLVSMLIFVHLCETVFGAGLPMGIGQRLRIHNRPCEAHVLRVRIVFHLIIFWGISYYFMHREYPYYKNKKVIIYLRNKTVIRAMQMERHPVKKAGRTIFRKTYPILVRFLYAIHHVRNMECVEDHKCVIARLDGKFDYGQGSNLFIKHFET